MMEEGSGNKRRTRYQYGIMVNGKLWAQCTRIEPAKAAQEAAKKSWAKGKKVEIREIKGTLCPF